MQILLGSFYFFYFGVVGVYVIFLPKVLSLLEYSSSEIGILFAASPLVRFLLPFAFQYGFSLTKNYFYASLVLMGLSSISFYFTITNFYLFFLCNIAMGVAMSLILPYLEVIALDTIKKERYGKVRLFGSLGFIFVALVLVRFLDDPYVAVYYTIFFTFFTILFAFIIASNKHTTKNQTSSTKTINLLKEWQLWLGLTLMQISFGAFYNFFTIYETAHGISLSMTINLWVFGVVVEVFMLFFQGKLLQNYSLVKLLQLSTLSAVLRWFLVFAFPTNLAILFFAQSLHALSFALFYSAAISYLHHKYENKVLAQQFFSGVTFGFGGLVGSIMFGYIYTYYQNYIFLVAATIAFAATLLLLKLKDK